MKEIKTSIDIETTGLDWFNHEIVQIAVIPFENFKPVGKFVSYVKPLKPELATEEAMKINKLNLEDLKKAPTPFQVKGMFLNWKNEMFGEETIFAPLGCNYGGLDGPMLKLFFSSDIYDLHFSHRVLDITSIGRFLIDTGDIKKVGFTNLLKYFNVECSNMHDAYSDAVATIEIYKKMVEMKKFYYKKAVL